MDIEERMAKVETDVAVLKEVQRLFLQEMGELRGTMERGFAEVRAALVEERAERQREFRWMFSTLLAILALVLGMVARMAGIL
ncbi:hypothetical protein ABT364_05215 [Massilia sp. SR12]